MKRLLEKGKDTEYGFTLIEILVVILIIGILAAIAIPVFLNQRKQANDAVVESAVHNATISVETYFTNNPTAPKVVINDLKTYMKKDASVRLSFSGTAEAFCIEGGHLNGGKYVINSTWSSFLVYSSVDGKTFVGNNAGRKCEEVGGGETITHTIWNYGD